MKSETNVSAQLNASKKLDAALIKITENEQKALAANKKNTTGKKGYTKEAINAEVKGSLKIQDQARERRGMAWAAYRKESNT